MKRIILLFIVLMVSTIGWAQTDGLSYQAVIIDPNAQELPGANAAGTILPNAEVSLRFTILRDNGTVEYREIQDTTTDAYGMVNVIIGQGESTSGNSFTDIFWDGNRKDLQVDIRVRGNFVSLSEQALTFIPYALHRDIIATGTMNVDGIVSFGNNLIVDGTTDLNSRLSINNESPTILSGTLSVDGVTDLNSRLDVLNESPTNLSGTLNVESITNLNSTLEVDGQTNLNDKLDVDGDTQLNSNLAVDGITTLKDDLTVENEAATLLTGTLTVNGETNLESDVFINNNSNLNLNGNLNVGGETIFEDDLTVNGDTNLNSSLSVNNNSPSLLSGRLDVMGETLLGNSLQVNGITNLENRFFVNNASPSQLSGSLTVALQTNLNSSLSVNNGSPTFLSGPLEVDGPIGLNNNLTVNGVTNLNGALFVNNNSPTNLSGILDVVGNTGINGILIVDGATTLNESLTVANAGSTLLTGTLSVDGTTVLNNSLDVTNASPTSLTGTLVVDDITTLNNDLTVTNGASTQLSGTLNVDGETTLNNNLEVTNGSPTLLTGILNVDGETNLNDQLQVLNASPTSLTGNLDVDGETTLQNTTTVNGATTINNDLSVTGNTFLGSLQTETINVESDNSTFVASFVNTNSGDGDGISIKLGKLHGGWDGSDYLSLPNPYLDSGSSYTATINLVKTLFQTGGQVTPNELINIAPTALRAGGVNAVNSFVFSQMNTSLGLPKTLPGVTFPGVPSLTQTPPPLPPFPGVTIPFVDVTIPGWQVPNVSIPSRVLNNPITNWLPSLPNLSPGGGLPPIEFPNLPTQIVDSSLYATSLTKRNIYLSFKDKDDRVTGTVRAQSLQDFANTTYCDPVYLLNVIAEFIGVDLLDKVVAGSVAITNFIDAFNEIGVEYTSGNGDYAEWLIRKDPNEFLTAGDIVAVVGGQITKDISEVEQIMVVSHRPIILGNMPEEGKTHLGNNVAFMGQVPVKVMGPVRSGDYIVAHPDLKGYGRAISPKQMTAADFQLSVGRSWEENLNQGPKMINTVVGVHNGDWAHIIQKLKQKQASYEEQFKLIEAKVESLENDAEDLILGKSKRK